MFRHISIPFKATLLAACVVATPIGAAHAQTGADGAGSPTTGQLQLELDALNSMTDALGPMVRDASTRQQQMQSFIAEQNLNDAFRSFQQSYPQLTFQQAYEQAVKEQKARGQKPGPESDPGMLAQEVPATSTMVHSQWDRLHRLHEQVGKMGAFIASKDMMREYDAYAKTAASKRVATASPAEAPTDRASTSSQLTPEQRAANVRKYREQVAKLRKHWDHYHFTSAVGPTPPGGPFSLTPSPGWPTSTNLQSGFPYRTTNEPNSFPTTSDYYGGSWWNGYADPYYDVWGHHHDLRDAPAEDDVPGNRLHSAYARGLNPQPMISPQIGHPSVTPARPVPGARK